MKKKRYWVFGYDKYYPAGGMDDFQGDFDTIEEVDQFIRERRLSHADWDYVDIYDALTDATIQR